MSQSKCSWIRLAIAILLMTLIVGWIGPAQNFPIITLSTIVPIAVGGVGIREWTAVLLLLQQFDVSESASFNAFLTHFIVVTLLPALAGTYLMSTSHKQ